MILYGVKQKPSKMKNKYAPRKLNEEKIPPPPLCKRPWEKI